jgi:hypothetical protein
MQTDHIATGQDTSPAELPFRDAQVLWFPILRQGRRQLDIFVGKNQTRPNTDSLEGNGNHAHHDEVSGTEKKHVANDHAEWLGVGSAEVMSPAAA